MFLKNILFLLWDGSGQHGEVEGYVGLVAEKQVAEDRNGCSCSRILIS
jgi:hypothetical protein